MWRRMPTWQYHPAMKLILAIAASLMLLACAGTSSKFTPPPAQQTTPIAKSWTVTLSGSNPPGWSFTPVSLNMSALPVGTCMTDFQNNGVAGLPATFGSCSYVNNRPIEVEDLFFATGTAQLYAGETVYFWVQYSDGTNTGTFSGQGAFQNNVLSTTLTCVSYNGSPCTWQLQLTAE